MSRTGKVPWDYSIPGDGEPAVPNLPTPEGEALGAELARLCDVAEVEELKRFPNQLPRCQDCALRAGTLPNGCLDTLGDVIKCLVEGEVFYCHKGIVEGEAPKRMCSGFATLMGVEARRKNRGRR